jgi:hypothetical protein
MSGTLPTHITPPSLDAYPFITAKFLATDIAIEHIDEGAWPTENDDAVFESKHITLPGQIKIAQCGTLTGMHDSTFVALFSILKVSYANFTAVTSKADLSKLAARDYDLYWNETFRDDQLQAYLLYSLTMGESIHWGQLTDLYNASSPGQQQSISDYFKHFKNRSLVDLLSIPAPIFTIPDRITRRHLSKVENGQTYCFSDIKQTWLRDDVFQQQFVIKSVFEDGKTGLVGSAPTLAIAIAKATQFALAVTDDSSHTAIRINIGSQRLAFAKMISIQGHQSAVKLTWNINSVGDNCKRQPISEHCARGYSMKEAFAETLKDVEKELGVQWYKAQRLEDELGL